jgi:hypothetical protein
VKAPRLKPGKRQKKTVPRPKKQKRNRCKPLPTIRRL